MVIEKRIKLFAGLLATYWESAEFKMSLFIALAVLLQSDKEVSFFAAYFSDEFKKCGYLETENRFYYQIQSIGTSLVLITCTWTFNHLSPLKIDEYES